MGGTRTLNPVRERDFESRAYTIPPPWHGEIVPMTLLYSKPDRERNKRGV